MTWSIAEIAQKRYATKAFDPDKKIPADLFAQIEQLLRFSPSSVNSQPWLFIVVSSAEGKEKLFPAMRQAPYSNNLAKVRDASHIVVFCAKKDMADADLEALADQEDKDGRYPDAATRELVNKTRRYYVDLHRSQRGDIGHWTQKQVYLSLGFALLGAAALGIDAVPIEGFDADALNAQFGLADQNYTATVLAAFGYRAPTDFNACLPKSRLSAEKVILRI